MKIKPRINSFGIVFESVLIFRIYFFLEKTHHDTELIFVVLTPAKHLFKWSKLNDKKYNTEQNISRL